MTMSGQSSLSEEEKRFFEVLCSPAKMNQAHLFEGIEDPLNHPECYQLIKQLFAADQSVAGGLEGYLKRARVLLQESKEGVNPFEGCVVKVPEGEKLEPGSDAYAEFEKIGESEGAKMAFCLVAGGLGERLGYPGIKIALPADSQTGSSMIEYYCDYILAIQRMSGATKPLPLAIMTSADTHQQTVELLQKHNNFGMEKDQITLMQQEKVPALQDSEARIAVSKSDRFLAEMKPHGHGDVHTLLLQNGLPQKWAAEGKEWLLFFQDTNPLAFRAALACVGVSKKNGFSMNSMTVPRVPGEAAGGICQLSYDNGKGLTVNVEYNQLGPLLAGEGGDCAGADGFSPYPGNINCLLFGLKDYGKVLEATKGVVPEFVNPKYADASRTTFKSPTRLECMMQDIPRMMEGYRVGFTQLPRWNCFTAVKNANADAAVKASSGLPADSAFSGDRDVWRCNAKLLELAGQRKGYSVKLGGEEDYSFLGIGLRVGPRVSLHPSFGVSLNQIADKVRGNILLDGARTSMVVQGCGASLGPLEVKGALEVDNAAAENLTVENLGMTFKELTEAEMLTVDPSVQIRGYVFEKREVEYRK